MMASEHRKPSFASIAAIGTDITINPVPVPDPPVVQNRITKAVNSDDLKQRVKSTAKASSGLTSSSSSSSASSTAASSDSNSTSDASSPSSSSSTAPTPVSIPRSAPIPKRNAWNTDVISSSIETTIAVSESKSDLPTPAESKDMRPKPSTPSVDVEKAPVPTAKPLPAQTAAAVPKSNPVRAPATTKKAWKKIDEVKKSSDKPLQNSSKNNSDGNETNKNSNDTEKNPDVNTKAPTNGSAKHQSQNEKTKATNKDKPAAPRKDTKSISQNSGSQQKKKTFSKDNNNSNQSSNSNEGRNTKKSDSQNKHHGKNHNNNKAKKSSNNHHSNNNNQKKSKAKKQNKRKNKSKNKQKEVQTYIPTPEEWEAFKKSAVMQVEYFFTVDELIKNVYLRKQMDVEGYLPAAIVFNFPSVLAHCIPYYDLLEAIQVNSETLEVDMTNECLRIKGEDNYKRWLMPNADGTFGVTKWIKDWSAEEQAAVQEKGDEGASATVTESEGKEKSEISTEKEASVSNDGAVASAKGDLEGDAKDDKRPELTMTDSDSDNSQ